MDERPTEPATETRPATPTRSLEPGPTEAPSSADVFLDIAADPERVWHALTTEGGLAPWMGDGATIEPEPGGLVALPDPVGGATRRGRVDRVEHGQRLDYTWWPALRPAERTSVSITVVPTDGGCRVRVTERPTGAGSGRGRSPVGLWSWRLAVLAVSSCMSRV